MSIIIYKDQSANAIFIEDANGVQFLNSLQAYLKNPSDTFLSISNLAKSQDIYTDIPFAQFLDAASDPYGANAIDTVNALNAVFETSGATGLELPEITSSTGITITEGDSVNYELVATRGVGFEWENLPMGVITVEGNIRKLVGGNALTAAGSPYNITMSAINYNGLDTETLVLTVSSAPYNNTRAVKFNQNDYMDASATTANPLYRAGNGTGSSDAWSIVSYFDSGTSTNSKQTIISFGGSDQGSEGHIWVYWDASGGDNRIVLRYGTSGDYLQFETPVNSVQGTDGYKQILVTYDGGTTGNSGAQINDYYSRFKIIIDGVDQTLTTSNNNSGFTGEIKDDFFRVGEASFGGNHMRNSCLVDELAIWSSDESGNSAAIYNSGTTHNLALLGSAPDHYWRMGDGDTFPLIEDNIGSLDFTMFNMTAADIVNDVP